MADPPSPAARFIGETLFLNSAPLPVLLVPLAVAPVRAVAATGHATRPFSLATVGLGLVVGVIAVARTVGIVYDYRLRWTWVLGMLAFVVVAWTTWMVVAPGPAEPTAGSCPRHCAPSSCSAS